ncbi:MAG: manganese efflux pump MntP family protein [Luteimonas sp.]
MPPLSIVLLGVAMSTDAFAVAIGRGAAMHRPQLRDALRAGLIFGGIEGLTPLLGWLLGSIAIGHVAAWDHWIAFALLGLLGVRMIVAGLRGNDDDRHGATDAARSHGFWSLAAIGFATSIDAMAVGVGLAFTEVDIVMVSAVIALTTLLMVTAGILLGRALGRLAGRWAEVAGGVVLTALGALILHGHLAA